MSTPFSHWIALSTPSSFVHLLYEHILGKISFVPFVTPLIVRIVIFERRSWSTTVSLTWAWWWIGRDGFSKIFLASLGNAAFRRMYGRWILAKTESQGTGVDFMLPVMVLRQLFSLSSTRFAWELWRQTGRQKFVPKILIPQKISKHSNQFQKLLKNP